MFGSAASVSPTFVVLLSITLVGACGGCDRTDYPRVEYPSHAETAEPDLVVRLPDWTVGTAATTVSPPRQVRPGELLSFDGVVRPSSDEDRPGGTLVVIFQRNRQGHPVVANAIALPAEPTDGHLRYEVRLRAPRSPGEYEVEIHRVGGVDRKELIAAMTLAVRG